MPSKKSRGKRAKTRHKFKRKGPKLTVNKLLQEINEGAHVQIKINSSVHSAMPHRRFQGLTGKVSGKRGKALVVDVKQLGKEKQLIVNAAHLSVVGEQKAEAVEAGKPAEEAAA